MNSGRISASTSSTIDPSPPSSGPSTHRMGAEALKLGPLRFQDGSFTLGKTSFSSLAEIRSMSPRHAVIKQTDEPNRYIMQNVSEYGNLHLRVNLRQWARID